MAWRSARSKWLTSVERRYCLAALIHCGSDRDRDRDRDRKRDRDGNRDREGTGREEKRKHTMIVLPP